jgi:glycosyltransferase involved in cell wall biosynthesis
MRALFVSPYAPTPGTGGRTRLMNLMERLGTRHEVSLVAFHAPDQDPSRVSYPGALLPYPAPSRPPGLRGSIDFWRSRLFEPLPSFAAWARSPALAGALREEVARFSPDVVQFEHPEMGQYMERLPRTAAFVLDWHDVATRWLAQAVRMPGDWRGRAVMGLDLLKVRRYERRIARLPDAQMVCSALEAETLDRLAGITPIVVPNGVDASRFSPTPGAAEDPNKILFVGPLTYDANLDGMRWFTASVLPLIRRELGSARLDHIGLATEERFGEGVRMLGKAEDVRPHLASAPVSVVPVRIGTGTRYKILEALAMERAVVSTTLGAEGIGVTHNEHLLLADDPASFASAVVALMRSPAERARLGAAGRAFVAAHYAWEPLVASVEGAWSLALERRRPATSQE